jgi:hypothetical protein
MALELTADDLLQIDAAASKITAQGDRYPQAEPALTPSGCARSMRGLAREATDNL